MFNTSLPIGFLHIPKTAGGTVGAIITDNYKKRQIFSITGDPTYSYYIDILKTRNYTPENIKIYFGHYSYGVVNYFPEKVRMATMLREPVSRVISYYLWAKNNNKHFLYDAINKGNFTVNDCIDNKISIEFDNGQTRLLSGIDAHEDKVGDDWCDIKYGEVDDSILSIAVDNLDRGFELVGIQEYFNVSLWLFKKEFGWNIKKLTNKNVAVKCEQFSPYEKDEIGKFNKQDIRLYERALKKFERNIFDITGNRVSGSEELGAFDAECRSKLEEKKMTGGKARKIVDKVKAMAATYK